MFAHHNELFSSNKGLKTSVERLVARMDHRLSAGPDHVLCSWKKLFHELVLGAHCHVDDPIVRRVAHPEWVAAVDQVVDRDLGFINGHEFHIAIHCLACCAFHDNMDPGAKRRRYYLGIATQKAYHFGSRE